MSLPKAIGLGAGGHARSLMDALGSAPQADIVGFLDVNPALWGTTFLGVPVVGGDEKMAEWRGKGVVSAVVTLGGRDSTAARRAAYERLLAAGFAVLPVRHARASVSPLAQLGAAHQVLCAAVVNAGVRLGANVLINTAAVVEHDCVVADHVHVGSGAILGGGVRVEEGALIGAGAVILPGARIGKLSVVGCGAVVTRDVPDHTVVVGNPAKARGRRA